MNPAYNCPQVRFHANQTHFRTWARFEQRHEATRKWPIGGCGWALAPVQSSSRIGWRVIQDQGFESNDPPSRSRGALLRLLSTLSRKYKPFKNKQRCESCDFSITSLVKRQWYCRRILSIR